MASGLGERKNLKIYFAGSIRGGRDDASIYATIVSILKRYGTVLTEHVANVHAEEKHLTDKEIHDRDVEWLQKSDVLIAEVTQTSMGVGYELGRAVAMGKRVLCLFRPTEGKRISAMISGAEKEDLFEVKFYKTEEIEEILVSFLEKYMAT